MLASCLKLYISRNISFILHTLKIRSENLSWCDFSFKKLYFNFFPFESHLIFQQIQVEVQLGRFYTYNVQFRKALRLEERFCPQDVSSRKAFLLQDALSIKEYMTYNFTTQYLFICNRNMWLVKRGYKPYSNYKFCYSNPPPPPPLSATIQ